MMFCILHYKFKVKLCFFSISITSRFFELFKKKKKVFSLTGSLDS